MEPCQSDHRVLGRVLVVPNFFHLRMMEATVLMVTYNVAEFFEGTLPQISASTQSCVRALWTIPSTSLLGFWSDMHCQLKDLMCVSFQIMSNQLVETSEE
jgi:hypothetical protein